MNPLSIFTGPYALLAKWAVIGLLCIAVWGHGWIKGNQHGTEKLTNYIAEEAKQAARIIVKQGKATEKVITKYVKVQGETKVVTQTVEKEVLRYANTGLCLDDAWRRLHDYAALNTVPNPTGRPDVAREPPKAVTALSTVTSNYSACHQTADRLEALQDWIRAQQAVR